MMDDPRFIGMDIHKAYVMICGVDQNQQVILKPRRIKMDQFRQWVSHHLHPTDEVVFEATSNAWELYDNVEPLVARAVVVHPHHVQMIASAAVKTDKRDALALARLLAAKMTPEVWVPPLSVCLLRSLVNHRQQLKRQRVATTNRLHALLHRYNFPLPEGGPFTAHNRTWWFTLAISPIEQLRVRHDLTRLDQIDTQLQEVEQEFARQSVLDPWKMQMPFLLQLPGIGVLSAMTILSAIGDISRFPSADQLVGYTGLGARVYASGQTHHTGPITKQGRSELRRVMIEVAWMAVRYAPTWQQRFAQLAQRRGKQKAITAIARKLLVVIWHVLTKQCLDREADHDAIKRVLLRWATRYRLARSLNMSRQLFVQQALSQLGIAPVDLPATR
jgi:transposase